MLLLVTVVKTTANSVILLLLMYQKYINLSSVSLKFNFLNNVGILHPLGMHKFGTKKRKSSKLLTDSSLTVKEPLK